MTKSIISFTFLGTAHHRETHPCALVGSFDDIQSYSNKHGSPVVARLFDGPGCVGSKDHPMPGTYIYEHGQKKTSTPFDASQLASRLYAAATGEGIESTLMEATVFLEEFRSKHNSLPKTINLQGFSRGADTCVRLANLLNRLYPEIEVNLFLIDPVPGPGRRDDPDSFTIPENVKDFRSSMMLNEHRAVYKPQHPGRYIFKNVETKVSFNTYAGRHGAGISVAHKEDTSPYATQVLVQDEMLKFNMEHGSLPVGSTSKYDFLRVDNDYWKEPLAKPLEPFSPRERFSYFCASMDSFRSLAERVLVKLVYYCRTILKKRADYLLDATLFLNQEHRHLCKEAFPAVFNWFFEKNVSVDGKKYTKEDVLQELFRLKQKKYQTFYKRLLTRFTMSDVHSIDDIPEPQGLKRADRCDYGKPVVHDELSYLQHGLKSTIDYYHYHYLYRDNLVLSTYQVLKIQSALKQSLMLTPEKAKQLLQKVISEIKAGGGDSYISKEVGKMVTDSQVFIQEVAALLDCYKSSSAGLLQPIQTVIALIKKEIQDKAKDPYQKRGLVQSYVQSLHNTILAMPNRSPSLDKLSSELSEITNRSDAGPKLIDTIIREVKGYLAWRRFTRSNDSHHKAQDLLRQLDEVKTEQGNNLGKIKDILVQASHGHFEPTSGLLSQGRNWKKQKDFKADKLNHIIVHNIHKVTALASIALPKGDRDSQHLDLSPRSQP